MNNSVNYIKHHIETDFFVLPGTKQKVARLLLALIKIRKIEDYLHHTRKINRLFKEKIKRVDRLKAEEEKKLANYLSEIEKVISAINEMSEEDVIVIKKYLEGLIPKKEDALEEHICNELVLASVDCFNPDDFQSEDKKLDMIHMLISNIGNKENFRLHIPDNDISPKINDIIIKYYIDRGYSLREKMFDNIVVEKIDHSEKLWIPVIDTGKTITISILNLY